MQESQAPRMQGDNSLTRQGGGRAERFLGPVQKVSKNRPPTLGGLDPNLVHAARLRTDFQERQARAAGKFLIIQHGAASAGSLRRYSLRACLLRQLEQPVAPLPFGWLNDSF